jgi:hypothetical protein
VVGSVGRLPRELVALVSNVELHGTAWWSEAVESVVLTVLYRESEPIPADWIYEQIYYGYGTNPPIQDVIEALANLEAKDQVTKLPDDRYMISDGAARKVQEAITLWDKTRSDARQKFAQILQQHLPDIETNVVWQLFEAHLLSPMVRELGASTWNFLAREHFPWTSLSEHLYDFLQHFPAEMHAGLRATVGAFLDPQLDAPRVFISDTLSAYFFVTACGLTSDQLTYIQKMLPDQFQIDAFMDIDLVLGLNGLFDPATNHTAINILTLREERVVAQVILAVSDLTVKEAAREISLTGNLCIAKHDVRMTIEGPFADTVQGLLSGLLNSGDRDCRKYFDEWSLALADRCSHYIDIRHTTDDAFYDDPRVSSGVRTYQEMLSVSTGAKIRDESLPRLQHDVALRFLVRDLRGGSWPSLVQNRYWVVTDNNSLLRFDAMNAKLTGDFPVCVHPTTLLQMLRLWRPRDDAWDRAAVSSLRLPLTHLGETGKLDHAALKVLSALTRYEELGDNVHLVLSSLVNGDLRNTVERSAERLEAAEATDLQRAKRELDAAREELQKSRTQSQLVRQELETNRQSAQLRRFTVRMFAFATIASLIIVAPLTIVLKQNVAIFKFLLIASTITAFTITLVVLLVAWAFVASSTVPGAIYWRERLRGWLYAFLTLGIVNFLVALLAAAIYDAGKKH